MYCMQEIFNELIHTLLTSYIYEELMEIHHQPGDSWFLVPSSQQFISSANDFHTIRVSDRPFQFQLWKGETGADW